MGNDVKQFRTDAAVKLQKLIYKETGKIVTRDAAGEVVDAITLSVIKSIEHYLTHTQSKVGGK